MLYYFFSLSCYTIVSSIVLVNRSRPIHFLFSSFWGAIDQSSLVYIYFRCFWFFISLLVWYNSYFLSYLLNSNAKGLYFIKLPLYIAIPLLFCHCAHRFIMLLLSPLRFVYLFCWTVFRQLSYWGIVIFVLNTFIQLFVYYLWCIFRILVLTITNIRHIIQIAAIFSPYC